MLREKRNLFILLTAISLLFIQYFFKNKTYREKDKYYNEMVLAAKKMQELSIEIKKEKLNRGFEIDKNIDKNLTGLIGFEWSEISTTLGDEVAKRTTTNPDFAALLVKKFKELSLKEGDIVAVNMSSSFPALNLAVISALDSLNLEGIIINTVGSSSYGANIKDFNYLDMENYLYMNKLIKNRSIAYSLGGVDDIGKEFEAQVIEDIKTKNKNYGLQFFYNPNLKENIEERYNFYKQGRDIKAFINIGGNILAFGRAYSEVDNSDVILAKNLKVNDGLVGKFYNSNIPVIHLLNIKGIALKNKIPIDPENIEDIGSSNVYFQEKSNLYFNIVIIFIVFAFIIYNIFGMKKFLDK